MNSNRRTQGERSAATRDALIAAGRALFGARGYADVATEEVVRAAGVSRGALYHHFADKAELFAAVFESVEEMTSARIVAAVTAAGQDDPIVAMQLGTAAFLDICTESEMARIMLIDAPAVLGAQGWSASPRTLLCPWRASCSARSARPRSSSPPRPTPPPPATRWAPY